MYMFGAGNVFLTESGVSNPKTHKVGTLQEVSFDISFESKELYGNKQFPVMVARGKGKISGKAKSGEFRGAMITSLLSGATRTSGRKLHATGEQHSAPTTTTTTSSGSPGTVTVTVTNAATFAQDLGVSYGATHEPLTRVAAGSEAVGKYSVDEATGVYTFSTADAAAALLFDYVYTAVDGSTILYSNQLMGAQSIYSLGLYNTEPDGSKFGIKFMNVVIPKLGMGFKNDDFTMPDLDLSAFAATNEAILEAYTPEAA
jgi:hypothetical protein